MTKALSTRDTVLLWWAHNQRSSAAQVAAHFNGPGRLSADAPDLPSATLRKWKQRHGLPPTDPGPAPVEAPAPPAPAPPGAAAAAVWINVQDVNPWDANPRLNDHAVEAIAASIRRFGYGRTFVGWRPDAERMLVVGHTARKAVLYNLEHHPDTCPPEAPAADMIPMRWRSDWTEPEARAYAIADNQLGTMSGWLNDVLATQMRELDAMDAGLTPALLGFDSSLEDLLADLEGGSGAGGAGGNAPPRVALALQFGAPPFSVLDARQGYWKARKDIWWGLGLDPSAGRGDLVDTNTGGADKKYEYMAGRGRSTGGSAFDPVLAELMIRWFCPPGGHVLDPFGGEAVKGVIAGILGYPYTAVELRPEQVEANRAQWPVVRDAAQVVGHPVPTWIQGDSTHISTLLPQGTEYDFVLTSPPYFDLEIYSDNDGDGSALRTYAGFMEWYRAIFAATIARMRDGRFLVVKVADVRDKVTGAYCAFVADNIRMFMDLGLHFYNEAVLITPIGTMPIRAGKAMRAARKLCRGHQNVIIFYKGDPRAIRESLGDLPELFTADLASASQSGAGEADPQ